MKFFRYVNPHWVQAATEVQRRSSIKTLVERTMIHGRRFLRSVFSYSRIKNRTELYKVENPYRYWADSVNNSTSLSVSKNVHNCINISRACYLYRSVFEKVSKWASNSLAATLRRNTAKQLMYQGFRTPLLGFVGFCLAKGPTLLTEEQESEGVCWEIRDVISHVPWKIPSQRTTYDKFKEVVPISIQDFEIGTFLAKGCNAAIYSALCKQLRQQNPSDSDDDASVNIAFNSKSQNLETESYLIQDPVCHETAIPHSSLLVGLLTPYDLAIKMMFNYDAESNATAVWKAMCKEIIPAIHGFHSMQSYSRIRSAKRRNLPPHPNIVEMYCAFADWVPSFPEALKAYPDALPARLNCHGCGRNMTLFLIMKRYHCSLDKYLTSHCPSTHTSLLLLTQLLEGIVHLSQHQMVHRDLKLDNILVDTTYGVANPMIAITDFGCCLESLYMAFPTEEVNKGGNIALMAPEVIAAEPGPFSLINYSRADLWTAGTMAYEIFGSPNPFYHNSDRQFSSATYKEDNLPDLPSSVPPVLSRLIKDILNRDLKKRPSPSLAATVCQLLLHGTPDLFTQDSDISAYKKILKWLVTLTAVSICQSFSANQGVKISPLKLQLCHTFLSRIQLSEVLEALHYIKSV